MIVVQRRRSDGEVQEEQKGMKGGKKAAGTGISAQAGSKGGWRNLALNQPGARPSPNNQQPGQARINCDAWNYNWGLPCHSMALDDQKSKCYCISLQFLRCT
jgi:hypothetical protein